MYFRAKNTLKYNCCHTVKHPIRHDIQQLKVRPYNLIHEHQPSNKSKNHH